MCYINKYDFDFDYDFWKKHQKGELITTIIIDIGIIAFMFCVRLCILGINCHDSFYTLREV